MSAWLRCFMATNFETSKHTTKNPLVDEFHHHHPMTSRCCFPQLIPRFFSKHLGIPGPTLMTPKKESSNFGNLAKAPEIMGGPN